jgi:nickel superoxide dismutase
MRVSKPMRVSVGVLVGVVVLAGVLGVAMRAGGHCQIPCGIYDDELRFDVMDEHIETITKSINEINTLSDAPQANANQIARWVINKDEHADELTEIVAEYFLAQRIKPVSGPDDAAWNDYVEQVVACHKIIVAAMKAKQSSDVATTETLQDAVDAFRAMYLTEDDADESAVE